MSGLPLGPAKSYGEAFQAACSELGANAVSQWSSDAVDAVVAQGTPTAVNLLLRRSGAGVVNVGLPECSSVPGERQCEPWQVGNCVEAGTRRCDDACMWGECQCAAGLTACGDGCYDLVVNHLHCGNCSTACAPSDACMGGTCILDVP